MPFHLNISFFPLFRKYRKMYVSLLGRSRGGLGGESRVSPASVPGRVEEEKSIVGGSQGREARPQRCGGSEPTHGPSLLLALQDSVRQAPRCPYCAEQDEPQTSDPVYVGNVWCLGQHISHQDGGTLDFSHSLLYSPLPFIWQLSTAIPNSSPAGCFSP